MVQRDVYISANIYIYNDQSERFMIRYDHIKYMIYRYIDNEFIV